MHARFTGFAARFRDLTLGVAVVAVASALIISGASLDTRLFASEQEQQKTTESASSGTTTTTTTESSGESKAKEDNTTTKCPTGYVWDSTTGSCVVDKQKEEQPKVPKCPSGYVWNTTLGQCVVDKTSQPKTKCVNGVSDGAGGCACFTGWTGASCTIKAVSDPGLYPRISCVQPDPFQPEATLVSFGYESRLASSSNKTSSNTTGLVPEYTVSHGPYNTLLLNGHDVTFAAGVPTVFRMGIHDKAFTVRVTAADSLLWQIVDPLTGQAFDVMPTEDTPYCNMPPDDVLASLQGERGPEGPAGPMGPVGPEGAARRGGTAGRGGAPGRAGA